MSSIGSVAFGSQCLMTTSCLAIASRLSLSDMPTQSSTGPAVPYLMPSFLRSLDLKQAGAPHLLGVQVRRVVSLTLKGTGRFLRSFFALVFITSCSNLG